MRFYDVTKREMIENISKSIIIIIEKEGEYRTSLWYCVTTLYGVHDLCNDIHIQSGFTVCPTNHTAAAATCIDIYWCCTVQEPLATCP